MWCGRKYVGIVSMISISMALWLVSCTSNDRSTTGVPESTATPTTLYETLTTRLAEIQHAQALALSLWDRLISGAEVSCQETIPQPELITLTADDLRAYPNAASVRDALNAASQAIRNSSDLWNIECNEARDIVPLSMARDGRATALLATQPLANAAALLAAWN